MQAHIITESTGLQKVRITRDKEQELFFEHLTGPNYNLVYNQEEIGFIIPEDYSYRDEESSFKKLFGFWWFFNGNSRDVISSVREFFENQEYFGFLTAIKENNLRIQREAREKEAREALENERAAYESKEAERKDKYLSDREEASKFALSAAIEASARTQVKEDARIRDLERQENEAATKIQANWRMLKAQKELKALRDLKAEAERKLALEEERRLEELKLQMEREAKELQEARAAQDAKRQKELEDREAENAARLKAEKEALIEARKAKAEELKAKMLAKDPIGAEAAEAKLEATIEEHKPMPVKIMEAKFFICEIQPGRKLVMQYSSESSDGSQGSKGMPDHIVLVNTDTGIYKLGPGSFLNGQPIENIEINYPSHKGSALRVLPSDIKGYGEIAPNLDMFYLALLCWNPRQINTEVFSVDHFDLDGFHYKGNEQFEHNSGMWKFQSTMDNGFVGEALSALESDFPG